MVWGDVRSLPFFTASAWLVLLVFTRQWINTHGRQHQRRRQGERRAGEIAPTSAAACAPHLRHKVWRILTASGCPVTTPQALAKVPAQRLSNTGRFQDLPGLCLYYNLRPAALSRASSYRSFLSSILTTASFTSLRASGSPIARLQVRSNTPRSVSRYLVTTGQRNLKPAAARAPTVPTITRKSNPKIVVPQPIPS